MSTPDGKPTNLKSGLSEYLGHLPPDEWKRSLRILSTLHGDLSHLADQLSGQPSFQGALRGYLKELRLRTLVLEQVGKGVHHELVDISTGLNGFMGILDKLGEEPLNSAETYCLLLPLVRQVGALNAATEQSFY